MRRPTKLYILLFLVFLLVNTYSSAQVSDEQIPSDSVSVEPRSFDQESIKAYQSDPDFQYGVVSPTGMSLWDRIKLMIGLFLAALFSSEGGASWVRILLYIVCTGVVIYVVLKLLNVDIKYAFYRTRKRPPLSYHTIEDDIHEMDFEQLIHQALNQEQYREAIRLLYLSALKKLTDHELLSWQPGKTNHDYMRELDDSKVKGAFDELSYYFEYSWYGQFPIDKSLYHQVASEFDHLDKKLTSRS